MGDAPQPTCSEGVREGLRASYLAGVTVVVAIDAGTTGVRALAVSERAEILDISYRELNQHFPRPGWVEHDAGEIFSLVEETLGELTARLLERGHTIAAIGITNQRETALAWDRSTGEPLHAAIVWQDRRTADRCRQLEEAGHLPLVRSRTGLVLDSYFSATKWEWMLKEGGLVPSSQLALGTVDDWLAWKLTGRHVTDVSNASRTLCYDLGAGSWSEELCLLFGLPLASLGEVVASSGRIGPVSGEVAGGRLGGVPLSGLAGDQQAALFGQRCTTRGATKVTYGTGSFVLMNVGPEVPAPVEGLVSTVAWQLGEARTTTAYALEGSVFSSGAAIQWLRDGLGIIAEAAELEPLASSVSSSGGVYLVPAFVGLGSPWWDPSARGVIGGLTKGTGRAELARAVIEAMAFQVRDVLEAMVRGSGCEPELIRVDGGASVMDLLCQLQADQSQVAVVRPATAEVTALGAAFLAGLAEGVWSFEDLDSLLNEEARFEPAVSAARADSDHLVWLRALEASRHLA